MLKRTGILGLLLIAGTALFQPVAAFAQEGFYGGVYYGNGNGYYAGQYCDRDRAAYEYREARRREEWRERQWREHEWREHEWREHERREHRFDRDYYRPYGGYRY